VFDALISERPYKNAWTIEKSVTEINAGEGTQFDPHLVRIFNELENEFIQIVENWR